MKKNNMFFYVAGFFKRKKAKVNIQNINNELDFLENEYSIAIKKYENNPTKETGVEIDRTGSKLLNYIEKMSASYCDADFLSHEALLFAELIYPYQEFIDIHYRMMRDIYLDDTYSPSKMAYANMQRLMDKYLEKDKVNQIKEINKENGVDNHGFEYKMKFDIKKLSLSILCLVMIFMIMVAVYAFSEKIPINLSVALGLFALIFIMTLYIKKPSSNNYIITRIAFCIISAYALTAIPGYMELEYELLGFKVKTIGMISVFVLIYLVNPAKPMKMN
ncbi:hypothetical protein Pcaca05_42050 [Pectobacterium carotovorum subsp. carotovorum]|nr:hypothetical protein Pcaca05_42050 [Pectobacterium carotovorum subsp. carotovorum]